MIIGQRDLADELFFGFGHALATFAICGQFVTNVTKECKAWLANMLLAHIRRATIDDQKAVMEWLLKKFGNRL